MANYFYQEFQPFNETFFFLQSFKWILIQIMINMRTNCFKIQIINVTIIVVVIISLLLFE